MDTIVDIAQSVGGCRPKNEIDPMVLFFKDADNAKAIEEAKDKIGGYPARNRESYHTGLGMFGSWHDFCDYDPIYAFYNYARICAEYPKPANTQTSCPVIKSALVGLEAAKASAIATKDDYRRRAIDIKISEYNSAYANMNCDQWIIDQERIKAEEAAKRQELLAADLQAQAFDKASGNTPTSGSKTGTYVLYGFVGLSAVIFLAVLFKKD